MSTPGDYRVKIKFATLGGSAGSGQEEDSFWCRISTFGAGKGGNGMFSLPEKDDEVLVCCVDGDINQSVIVGTMWNGVDKPSMANKDATSPTQRFNKDHADYRGQADAKKNDIRSFSSRANHELIFNDNASNPRVTMMSGCKHRIVLNDEGNQPTKIEIYDGKEENYILINTKEKKITIESKTGDILIKAKEKSPHRGEEHRDGQSASDDLQSRYELQDPGVGQRGNQGRRKHVPSRLAAP